jgi:hypothetical protein
LKRRAILLAVSLLVGGAESVAVEKPMQPRPTASQAGGLPVHEAAALSSARLQQRAQLLKNGEAALARLDVTGALDSFERAALILHAPDTEIALIRSYMQAGDYRRALAFGAHTAGAHLDEAGGSLLYAWLLHIGGQPAIAQRQLTETGARIPENAVVRAVMQQLNSGAPIATSQLLALPTRLAPYGNASN